MHKETFGPAEKSNLADGSDVALPCSGGILICLLLINRVHVYSQKIRPGQTFQSASAPAHKLNPRDFPFQRVEKSYNITSFGVREMPRLEGLFQTFPDLGFSWEVSVSVLSWAAEGWKPVRFWDGADSVPSSISRCLHYEALLRKHSVLCGHGCVFLKLWR